VNQLLLMPVREVTVPESVQQLLQPEEQPIKQRRKRKAVAAAAGAGPARKQLYLSNNSPEWAKAAAAMQRPEVVAVYGQEAVDCMQQVDDKGCLFITMEPGTHCQMHGAAHRSNRTYFILRDSSLTQHCYDDDCKGKKYVVYDV
jgi:hypothetical protein